MNNFIYFKNIDFYYKKNHHIFSNLTIKIAKNEKVGIVGQSGAGKSTLVNLLLKNCMIKNYIYKDRSAEILDIENDKGGDIIINNQSIYNVSSDSLRSKISLIPQDILLFHRTIYENIAYSKENSTQKEVEGAAKIANIHDFIMTLPDKYNTLIGANGIKLSGGQRQRIAIARAVLKNAKILILDEATSSLDSITENQIQDSINKILDQSECTVIAIAHRLSTIRHMDRIILIHNGKIIEEGSFEELVNKNGEFTKLWKSQTNNIIK